MKFKKLADLDLSGKTVLIRQDLNVPVKDGVITSARRIESSISTIQYARDAGAAVLLMSHLGRPVEGEYDENLSLLPVAEYLSQRLRQKVYFSTDYLHSKPVLSQGDVCLLENVRFNIGETANDGGLGRQYAGLCDIYVMDAFGTAHRAQASTHSVGTFSDQACAGPLLAAELEALDAALSSPGRPMAAIVGGAKVSSKLTVLESLSDIVDQLIPGGGIANTFIAAAGYPVGKSLYEPGLVGHAAKLIERAELKGVEIPIPMDVAVAKSPSLQGKAMIKSVKSVENDDLILDIGPDTAEKYSLMMKDAETIIWNGPVGVFEYHAFSHGTRVLGEAVAQSGAFSIAGGGDTIAAIERYNLSEHISYISTGGGAFLAFLEGKCLPAVEMLGSRA